MGEGGSERSGEAEGESGMRMDSGSGCGSACFERDGETRCFDLPGLSAAGLAALVPLMPFSGALTIASDDSSAPGEEGTCIVDATLVAASRICFFVGFFARGFFAGAGAGGDATCLAGAGCFLDVGGGGLGSICRSKSPCTTSISSKAGEED